MRKLFFSTSIALALFVCSIQAQSNRLQTLADQLQQSANNLAEKTYEGFTKKTGNNRNEIEALLNAQQLSASADIFKRMVRDARQNPELRDAANIINDIAKRAPNNSPDINLWRAIQSTIKDISQEISASGKEDSSNKEKDKDKGKEKDDDEKFAGNVNWSGTVDHDVKLIIRGNMVEVQTLSGTPYNDAKFSFTSPLPNRNVVIEIEKRKARGSVQLIQQPNQANKYTAIIHILDKDDGAKAYELEIYWK